LNSKIDNLSTKFDHLDQKVDHIDQKVDHIDQKVEYCLYNSININIINLVDINFIFRIKIKNIRTYVI